MILKKVMNIINFLPTHSSSNENFIKRRIMQTNSFSGAIVSIVPVEARCSNRNGSRRGFETPKEPTSPKVSCIGQIKLTKNTLRSKSQKKTTAKSLDKQVPSSKHAKYAKTFSIRKIFQRKVKPGSSSSSIQVDHGDGTKMKDTVAVPSLGDMKKFVSRRESLGDFDWRKVQVEKGNEGGHEWFSDEDDDEIIVPHSAPIMMGCGVVGPEPKKEVNLWRRRTMLQPGPLHLN